VGEIHQQGARSGGGIVAGHILHLAVDGDRRP
jgi:hypothetical protein